VPEFGPGLGEQSLAPLQQRDGAVESGLGGSFAGGLVLGL
jgi:hypothetical protein